MYAPLARMQKFAMNHIHSRRITKAIKSGTKTPRIGPLHKVTSGMGSGLKMLYGKCQGRRSAFWSVPPLQQPPTMCPISWVNVITHHDAISNARKCRMRFAKQELSKRLLDRRVRESWGESGIQGRQPRSPVNS